jgi:hypothetical protein
MHHGIRGNLRVFRPTFESGNAAALKSFLQQSWPTFSRIWTIRRLNIIIRYLLLADRHEQPAEVALLLSFVTLEMLKTTYAKERGIPLFGGKFRKISCPPKANPKKEPGYTFEELLRLMLREVSMGRTALKDIIPLRNTIVHSGIATAQPSTLWASYEACHDLCREYILRLVGYKGPFWQYTLHPTPKQIR